VLCGNDTVMVFLGSGTSKVLEETPPEKLDPARFKYTNFLNFLVS